MRLAPRPRRVHPWPLRLMHWVNAVAMLTMIGSGWQIYNASPLFPFTFPRSVTIGGWLAAGIAWHLAALWLLVLNGGCYVAWGVVSGHFRQQLLPQSPRAIARDAWFALTFRLTHRPGQYNAVQRLLYCGVLLLGVVAVGSGFAVWKPVQLWWLSDLLGGYRLSRIVHFFAMSGIVLFILVHLALVALVPKVLVPMIAGGRFQESEP